jgi:hypothetical protein
MLDFMRSEYDGNWGPYSPVGVLEWHEHLPQPAPTMTGLGGATRVAQLISVRHPEQGWYFEYSSDREPRQWLVSIDPAANRKKWVRHWACGEETCFRAACFVSQAAGERVVLDFLKAAGASTAVEWTDFQPLWPRLELTEYRRRKRERRGRA